MNRTRKVHFWVAVLVVCCTLAISALGQTPGSLRGIVSDPSGAAIPQATVTLTGPNGIVKVVETGATGSYIFTGLPVGTYLLRVSAAGFSLMEKADLTIASGRAVTVDLKLSVAVDRQEVTVTDDVTSVEIDPTKNASATVLTGSDLDMLSDDPDDLQNDLQALAGPASGANGGQVFVDGFSNGQVPPKNSIREIRVNSNPFAAEFDRVGFGRVEILTRPGTDKLHGQMFYQADSGALDARNPFSTSKPSFLTQQFQASAGGALSKKASFFLDFSRRNQDDQALVRATVLDTNLLPVQLVQNIGTPSTRNFVSPRIDYQLGTKVTLQARYTWMQSTSKNNGVGNFNLPSQGTDSINTNHSAQLTETWVVNTTTVNESRFQYTRSDSTQTSSGTGPTIYVSGFFTGGGPNIANTFTDQDSYEYQNYTTLTHGSHLIKAGVRMRGTLQNNRYDGNFRGTFRYATLDDYRLGNPFQYTLSVGNPFTGVSQVDGAPFVQDDWRIKPSLTLSLGLRYELQNNITDRVDFAPRLGLAWGIGGGQGRLRQPKTVIRAGFGIFYDRLGLNQVVTTTRFDGINQQQYVIKDPSFSAGNVPPVNALPGTLSAIYRLDPNLVSPRIIQSAISLDRQLPKNVTLSVNYTNSRGLHQLRTRNITAPPPGTPATVNPIYQYESAGMFKQSQLFVNMNARFNPNFTMFGFYGFSHASSNTDGAGTFPAYSYDLSNEWSRAQFDIRHRFLIGGSSTLPWGIRLSPFMNYASPAPFNIVVGQDLNNDTVTNDRPSFATPADILNSNCSATAMTGTPCVISTAYGFLNSRPLPGETIIPRNYGNGFGTFNVNLRVSRTWGFGEQTSRGPSGGGGGGGGGRRGGGFGGPRGPGGGGMFGAVNTNRRYNLTLSVEARNLLNSVNPGPPVGTLTSALFGQPQGVAGGFGPGGGSGGTPNQSANRRLELQLRFSF